MVKRYYGGVMSATQAVANASSATGFFNVTQQMQAVQAGAWPLQAPPPQNTAAWFGGGSTDSGLNVTRFSTVQRITFATDTATASVRGPLSSARYDLAAAANNDYGWFGGGNASTGAVSTVDRITYATDTATTSVRGPLSLGKRALGAAGNTTNGWFGGGQPGAGPVSTVDRITYATDTATASVRGPLSANRYHIAAAGNSDYAWFGGGAPSSLVDRVTFATDTATASVRGPLSSNRYQTSATGNTTNSWWACGRLGAPTYGRISTVNRITYATDTDTASVRGPLSSAKNYLAAAGNTTDGWFGGTDPYQPSTVDRITYATDTATASVRGPLSLYNMGAAGGTQ